MSEVIYTLEEDQVRQTITIPERAEVRELGEKEKVIRNIEAEIANCQEIIDIYTAKKSDAEAKLAAINALKEEK